MNVSLKTFLPITLASAITLTACDSKVNYLAHQYCVENNKTVTDYDNIENTMGADKQISKLDSIAYSDIFNATKLIKDSAKVAEFNKIASQHRSSSYDQQNVESFLKTKAKNSGMSLKDYDEMCKCDNNAHYQHFLDNFVYQKFFNDNGVLDKNIKNKCDKYSQYAISVLKIR